ncbi:MAG: hypothetical protein ABIH92_01780, partial [Nanoarchaeota archaeon]
HSFVTSIPQLAITIAATTSTGLSGVDTLCDLVPMSAPSGNIPPGLILGVAGCFADWEYEAGVEWCDKKEIPNYNPLDDRSFHTQEQLYVNLVDTEPMGYYAAKIGSTNTYATFIASLTSYLIMLRTKGKAKAAAGIMSVCTGVVGVICTLLTPDDWACCINKKLPIQDCNSNDRCEYDIDSYVNAYDGFCHTEIPAAFIEYDPMEDGRANCEVYKRVDMNVDLMEGLTCNGGGIESITGCYTVHSWLGRNKWKLDSDPPCVGPGNDRHDLTDVDIFGHAYQRDYQENRVSTYTSRYEYCTESDFHMVDVIDCEDNEDPVDIGDYETFSGGVQNIWGFTTHQEYTTETHGFDCNLEDETCIDGYCRCIPEIHRIFCDTRPVEDPPEEECPPRTSIFNPLAPQKDISLLTQTLLGCK